MHTNDIFTTDDKYVTLTRDTVNMLRHLMSENNFDIHFCYSAQLIFGKYIFLNSCACHLGKNGFLMSLNCLV